jgi:hypothetical protein
MVSCSHSHLHHTIKHASNALTPHCTITKGLTPSRIQTPMQTPTPKMQRRLQAVCSHACRASLPNALEIDVSADLYMYNCAANPVQQHRYQTTTASRVINISPCSPTTPPRHHQQNLLQHLPATAAAIPACSQLITQDTPPEERCITAVGCRVIATAVLVRS